MTVLATRNTSLIQGAKDMPLDSSFTSNIFDFKECKIGGIQVVKSGGDVNDGEFRLEVSLLCDPDSFAPYPFSTKSDCPENNIIWLFNEIPFRFAMVVYTKGTDTVGMASVYGTGKQ